MLAVMECGRRCGAEEFETLVRLCYRYRIRWVKEVFSALGSGVFSPGFLACP